MQFTLKRKTLLDVHLEQNQDRITDRTWITRGNEQGIYNPFSESSYYFESSDEVYLSPSNTLWAFSSTAQASFEDYKPFKKAVQDSIGMQKSSRARIIIVYRIREYYFDVEFHSWTAVKMEEVSHILEQISMGKVLHLLKKIMLIGH